MAAAREQDGGDDARALAFALKDYEMKVGYVTSHLQRMWTRFNYFVIIEAALIGGKTVFGEGGLGLPGLAFGLGLSLLWYVMGAEDRYLLVVYRQDARRAGERAASQDPSYRPVGALDDVASWRSPVEWRVPAISTTRLAALIPLLVSLLWAGMLLAAA